MEATPTKTWWVLPVWCVTGPQGARFPTPYTHVRCVAACRCESCVCDLTRPSNSTACERSVVADGACIVCGCACLCKMYRCANPCAWLPGTWRVPARVPSSAAVRSVSANAVPGPLLWLHRCGWISGTSSAFSKGGGDTMTPLCPLVIAGLRCHTDTTVARVHAALAAWSPRSRTATNPSMQRQNTQVSDRLPPLQLHSGTGHHLAG